MINNIISCEFNIDTACVEVKLTDGSMVSIDCDAVENEYANNMYETSEFDYLNLQRANELCQITTQRQDGRISAK